jgi:hypothetical protein
VKKIFTEVLYFCNELKLIDGKMFAVDGCKLPSNASKEWSGTKKELKKKRDKRQIEKLDDFDKQNEPRLGSRGKEIHSNITDNESAKIKGPHGVIQGYNGIAIADGKNQVIVAAEAEVRNANFWRSA